MRTSVRLSAQVSAVSAEKVLPRPGVRNPAPVPVPDALKPVLGNGLRHGSVVSVTGPAATTLGFALMSGPSADGGWCAAVGVPELGVAAAAEAGVEPARLLLIDDPGRRWPEVTAALLEAVEIVLLRPDPRPDSTVVRRLAALARRHGSLIVSAGEWEGAQVRLRVLDASWEGVGNGHGHLRGRRALVHAEGRGATGPGRRAWIWLPDPDGRITSLDITVDATVPASGGYPPLAVAT